jgi:hypothetical protein
MGYQIEEHFYTVDSYVTANNIFVDSSIPETIDCLIVSLQPFLEYKVYHKATDRYFIIQEKNIIQLLNGPTGSDPYDDSGISFGIGMPIKTTTLGTEYFGTPIKEQFGGTKTDSGKPMVDLLDAQWLIEVSHVMTHGANKYSSHNWRKGLAYSRIIAATLRHLFCIMMGQDVDPETNRLHAAHASCELMFLSNFQLNNRTELDDRYQGDK